MRYFCTILSTMIALGGIAQTSVNKSYFFPKGEIQVFIYSFDQEHTTVADSLLENIFEDTPSFDFQVIGVQEISLSDYAILEQLAVGDYSKKEIKAGISLSEFISKEQRAYLKEKHPFPSMLLFPSSFTLGGSIITYGNATFRAFDLHSEQMIHQNTLNMNSNVPNEAGQKMLASELYSEERSFLLKQRENQ